MKAKKVLKQIAKIEALMSKVTKRSSPHIQELLQDAEAAITRAKKAVHASSGTPKTTPAKGAEQPPEPTAEPTKPRRKLSAAGRRAISEAAKKRWAAKRAVKNVAAKKATPVKAATPVQEVAKAPAKKAPLKAAQAPTRKLVKKAPVKKAAAKAPAKNAIRVVHVAKTAVPHATQAPTVTTPKQVAPEAPVYG